MTLESYICYIEWFRAIIPAQVVVNDGKLPLLGTELLAGRDLRVNYAARQLTLDRQIKHI